MATPPRPSSLVLHCITRRAGKGQRDPSFPTHPGLGYTRQVCILIQNKILYKLGFIRYRPGVQEHQLQSGGPAGLPTSILAVGHSVRTMNSLQTSVHCSSDTSRHCANTIPPSTRYHTDIEHLAGETGLPVHVKRRKKERRREERKRREKL